MSDEWTHGHPAGVMLRAISCALQEAHAEKAFFQAGERGFLESAASACADSARNLADGAYGTAVDIAKGLFTAGRALYGCPFGSIRLDYLLCRIAHKQGDWMAPLKRRTAWLRVEVETRGRDET